MSRLDESKLQRRQTPMTDWAWFAVAVCIGLLTTMFLGRLSVIG